jgi:hypothetical protein
VVSMTSITQLHRELHDEYVLSVYIAADEHDPAQRSSWRSRLAASLNTIETSLRSDASPLFARAREHVDARLQMYRGFLPGRGWAIFATAEGVHLAGELPAAMPDLVRWRRGPVLAPCLRAVKQEKPILVALIDSRRARLLRYQSGQLTEHADYRADGFIDDLTDRNASKRAATTSGIRGATATDAADRIRRQETQRLLRRVAEALRAEGRDEPIIIGGSAAAAAALAKMLHGCGAGSVLVEASLHVTMSASDILAVIAPLASSLTQAAHSALVHHVLDLAGADQRGVLGLRPTSSAGELGQVELLLLTPRFLQAHEHDAEALITRAFDTGTAVDIMVGDAAARLDDLAGGVAGRLRFVATPGLPRLEARQA